MSNQTIKFLCFLHIMDDQIFKEYEILRSQKGISILKQKSNGEIIVRKSITYTDYNNVRKRNEGDILKRVQGCKYIIKLIDVIDDPTNKTIHIIMEYCTGGDLQSKIRKYRVSNEYITEKDIWIIIAQLAIALHKCHVPDDGGPTIIHHDVKAENIFVNGMGNVKLGDFGLSREIQHLPQKTDIYCGTPYYMAPEKITRSSCDIKVDIWALGVVIYKMCVSDFPFNAPNVKLLIEVIQKCQTPKRISNIYSEELWNLIMLLLSKDPNDRPSTSDLLNMDRIRKFSI